MKLEQCTSIYRVIKTGVYVVQPYTIGPVAPTEFGDPTVIESDEFALRIANAVVENLEKFGKEPYDRARSRRRNPEQQKRFLKDHLGVNVHKLESGSLAVYPLHHERGGMVASDEDAIILSSTEVPRKLAAAIVEAFKRAT
jgi:hypothetical protein